jgi:hypothetical protein
VGDIGSSRFHNGIHDANPVTLFCHRCGTNGQAKEVLDFFTDRAGRIGAAAWGSATRITSQSYCLKSTPVIAAIDRAASESVKAVCR